MATAATAQSTSKLSQFWNHPAGPKTVFFWAPALKWGLVFAGLKDFNRPVETLSIPQNLALAATGMIWVRYSFVITPVNYSLAAVNVFVAGTALTNLGRAVNYQIKSPAEQAAIIAEREAKSSIAAIKE